MSQFVGVTTAALCGCRGGRRAAILPRARAAHHKPHLTGAAFNDVKAKAVAVGRCLRLVGVPANDLASGSEMCGLERDGA